MACARAWLQPQRQPADGFSLRLILLGVRITVGSQDLLRLALVLLPPGREDEALDREFHKEVEVGAVCCFG